MKDMEIKYIGVNRLEGLCGSLINALFHSLLRSVSRHSATKPFQVSGGSDVGRSRLTFLEKESLFIGVFEILCPSRDASLYDIRLLDKYFNNKL